MKPILTAGTALVSLVSVTFAQPEPVTASDLLLIRSVTDVRVSNDGQFAVYVVRSIHDDGDSEYSYRSHLWHIDLEPGAQPAQITSGERGDSQPRISPDGASLAFVRAGEGEDGEPQVWVLPLDGPGEARQLTTLEHGAASPVFKPDGSALMVTTPIPFSKIEGAPQYAMERPARDWNDTQSAQDAEHNLPDGDIASIRAWLANNASDQDPTVITRLTFQGEFGLREEETLAHLCMVDLHSGDAEQITDGFGDYAGAVFSPDGSQIAFSDGPRTNTHPDRIRRSVVYVMSSQGEDIRAVVGDENLTANSPRFAPDGRLLFNCRPTKKMVNQQNRIGRIHPDGTGFELIADAWDSHMNSIRTTPNGDVFCSTPWHGQNDVLRIVPGQPPVRVPIAGEFGAGVQAYDVGPGHFVAAVTSVEHPSRLIMLDHSGRETILHDLNEWTSERTPSMPTEHWITKPDGSRVQYWVMPPADSAPGTQYKTALEIHGGPSLMWGPGEFSMWHEFQLLCSFGYGVVYSNPRGSSGYGYDYQSANYRDWGIGPTSDVLAALDDAAENNPWIDPDQLVVTGGSYAGYLTAWIVAHDHRFKAAVAQRGVYDLPTFFGEGNAWILVPWMFGDMFDDEARAAIEHDSPFTHVDQIKTPLLIMHSSKDVRTGVSQSEMMYRTLKVLKREVEYVRYPDAGHDLSRTGDPGQRMDRVLRILEFFERYVGK